MLTLALDADEFCKFRMSYDFSVLFVRNVQFCMYLFIYLFLRHKNLSVMHIFARQMLDSLVNNQSGINCQSYSE